MFKQFIKNQARSVYLHLKRNVLQKLEVSILFFNLLKLTFKSEIE